MRHGLWVAFSVGMCMAFLGLWLSVRLPVWLGAEASIHKSAARYFYGADGFGPDKKKYRHYLEKAAYDGSARACLALGKLALTARDAAETTEEKLKQQKLASAWFQKAEEQNFGCFEKDVYEQLRQYK